MKFLYPIKKLNIKPWIKYWVLKKTSGESTLKAVTISSGTLKKVDKAKALSIKEYFGNTVQNGTPSPQAPVEIQTISGDNTFTINSVNYNLNLLAIELCKIGNYKDKIYNDNGTWKVEKNIGKVEIKQNGYISVQEIISGANKFIWRYASALNVAGRGNRDTLLCNYFVGDKSIWGNNNKIGAYINSSNQTNFAMLCSTVGGTTSNTKAELLSMLETWLSTHNTTVYYVLAEPTTTEITDATLISQLNALYEFYVNSSTVTISNNSEIPLEVLLEYYGR